MHRSSGEGPSVLQTTVKPSTALPDHEKLWVALKKNGCAPALDGPEV